MEEAGLGRYLLGKSVVYPVLSSSNCHLVGCSVRSR